MSDEHLLDDIRELNLAYLLLAQRLLHADRETATFRLQLSDEMAEVLGSTSVTELARLAECSQPLCRFAIEDSEQLKALLNAGAGDDLRDIHAAIILGSAGAARTIGSARASARAAAKDGRAARFRSDAAVAGASVSFSGCGR